MHGRREWWWRPYRLGFHPMHRVVWIITGVACSVLDLLWVRQRCGETTPGWLFGTHFPPHVKGNKHWFTPVSFDRGQRWCRRGLHIFLSLMLLRHRFFPVSGWLLRSRLFHLAVFVLHSWWPGWILLFHWCFGAALLPLIFKASQPLSSFIVGPPRIVRIPPPLGDVFFRLPLLLLAFRQAVPGRESWWAWFWQVAPLFRLFFSRRLGLEMALQQLLDTGSVLHILSHVSVTFRCCVNLGRSEPICDNAATSEYTEQVSYLLFCPSWGLRLKYALHRGCDGPPFTILPSCIFLLCLWRTQRRVDHLIYMYLAILAPPLP